MENDGKLRRGAVTLGARIGLVVVRITGPLQVVLGLLFWAGYARGLLMVHIVSGLALVLGLGLVGISAMMAGSRAPGAFALAWGAFTMWFGMVHPGILPGRLHWIARVAHLLIGAVAMGLADRLAKTMRAHKPADLVPSDPGKDWNVPQPAPANVAEREAAHEDDEGGGIR